MTMYGTMSLSWFIILYSSYIGLLVQVHLNLNRIFCISTYRCALRRLAPIAYYLLIKTYLSYVCARDIGI